MATQGCPSFKKSCPSCNHRSGLHFNNNKNVVVTTIDVAASSASNIPSCINLTDETSDTLATSIDFTADEYHDDIESNGKYI